MACSNAWKYEGKGKEDRQYHLKHLQKRDDIEYRWQK